MHIALRPFHNEDTPLRQSWNIFLPHLAFCIPIPINSSGSRKLSCFQYALLEVDVKYISTYASWSHFDQATYPHKPTHNYTATSSLGLSISHILRFIATQPSVSNDRINIPIRRRFYLSSMEAEVKETILADSVAQHCERRMLLWVLTPVAEPSRIRKWVEDENSIITYQSYRDNFVDMTASI